MGEGRVVGEWGGEKGRGEEHDGLERLNWVKNKEEGQGKRYFERWSHCGVCEKETRH